MNIAYLSFLFLCIISSSSNAMEMEKDIESGPTLVSSDNPIYFKMPKDLYTADIASLNLSDKKKSDLVKMRSIYDANMKKIEEYMDNQIKKVSESRNRFDRFFSCFDYSYEVRSHKIKSFDVDMEYYIFVSFINFDRCCRPDIKEFFYDQEYIKKHLLKIPGVTIMSEIDINESIEELKEAEKKKRLQQINVALEKITEKQ